MTFVIGQQVMCIKEFRGGPLNKARKSRYNLPQLFNIYTVRSYCQCSHVPAILLQEIENKEVKFVVTHLVGEASFSEKCFGPLEKLNEEIELETTA